MCLFAAVRAAHACRWMAELLYGCAVRVWAPQVWAWNGSLKLIWTRDTHTGGGLKMYVLEGFRLRWLSRSWASVE